MTAGLVVEEQTKSDVQWQLLHSFYAATKILVERSVTPVAAAQQRVYGQGMRFLVRAGCAGAAVSISLCVNSET